MRILIIKISSMGDIIHTLPAITDLSNTKPNILCDWVVEETFSEIPNWHPFIRKVIPIKLRHWKNKWYKLNSWLEYYKFINQLNTYKYDIVIDVQGLLKTSLFITKNITSGIKHSMNFFSAREPISCWFSHKNHYIKKNQHAIERIRQLFAYSLQYKIPPTTGNYNIVHNFKLNINYNNFSPYLIFFHNTAQFNKQWPEKNWHFLIKNAIQAGYQVKIPFWTKNEELRAKRLKKHFNQIIILPNFTLNKIANHIITSKATISVDTGLSHLSAALNCPNLTLYGPTNPKLIGTYGLNQITLHSPTKKMIDLNPDYVWKNFEEKLL